MKLINMELIKGSGRKTISNSYCHLCLQINSDFKGKCVRGQDCICDNPNPYGSWPCVCSSCHGGIK